MFPDDKNSKERAEKDSAEKEKEKKRKRRGSLDESLYSMTDLAQDIDQLLQRSLLGFCVRDDPLLTVNRCFGADFTSIDFRVCVA